MSSHALPEPAPPTLGGAGRPEGGYSVRLVSTRDLATDERPGYWRELVTQLHGPMDIELPRSGDFLGRAVLQQSRAYLLGAWNSEASLFHRTQRHTRTAGDDSVRLVLPIRGRLAVRGSDRTVLARPGTATLVRMDVPWRLWHASATRNLILSIRGDALERRLGARPATATPINLATGLGRVVLDMLLRLIHERHALDATHFDATCERLLDLLAMLLTGDTTSPHHTHLTHVEAAARRHIHEHAHQPDLDIHTVAHAIGWSVRQVQLALQHAGTTPTELIREERLQLVRQRLTDPAYRTHTIAAIGHASGFTSASTLSRAFRARFGTRPRDIRD